MDTKIGLENLILARDALTSLNVRYFLIDGTLLGLVRNGSFLDSDEDVDIGVLAEDFNIRSFGLYTSRMRGKEFAPDFYGVWGSSFIAQWWRKNVFVDLAFYFRRDDQRVAYGFYAGEIIEFSYPAWLIETHSPIEFLGQSFMAPKHEEAMLSHQYGNWQIPRADWDWTKSSLHITSRTRMTKWKKLQHRLSNRVVQLSEIMMMERRSSSR